MPRGSGPPAAIGRQRPGAPASPHDLQAPVQAFSQHTRSTQWLLMHSLSPAQLFPFVFGPQLLLTPATPGAQSTPDPQVLTHAPFAQRYE